MKFLKNKPGVSLVELSFILAIMAVLALTATARFTSTDSIKLDAASKKIFSDLQYLRHFNITHPSNARTILFNFNSTINRYSVHQTYLNDPVDDPVTKQDWIVDFDDIPEYRGVSLSFTPSSYCTAGSSCNLSCTSSTCTNDAISFYEDRGVPWCTRIFLNSYLIPSFRMIADSDCAIQYATITLSIGSRTKDIYILPETGKISFSNIGGY